jgi:hypothetical protein
MGWSTDVELINGTEPLLTSVSGAYSMALAGELVHRLGMRIDAAATLKVALGFEA